MSNFNLQTQILTGASRRRQKAENNPVAFTRAQARRAIANTSDIELLRAFTEHKNSHVKKAAEYKIGLLERKGCDVNGSEEKGAPNG